MLIAVGERERLVGYLPPRHYAEAELVLDSGLDVAYGLADSTLYSLSCVRSDCPRGLNRLAICRRRVPGSVARAKRGALRCRPRLECHRVGEDDRVDLMPACVTTTTVGRLLHPSRVRLPLGQT